MDPQTSQQFFKQADALFRGGRYGDALIFLEKLDRAHPRQKNVLFPMAMCLTELGREGEALPICEDLIERFDLPRAKALRSRIIENAPTERNQPVAKRTTGLDRNTATKHPKVSNADHRRAGWVVWAAAGAILTGLVLAAAFLTGSI